MRTWVSRNVIHTGKVEFLVQRIKLGPRSSCMKKYQMFSRRLYPTTNYGQDSTVALIFNVSIHYGGGGLAVLSPTVGC